MQVFRFYVTNLTYRWMSITSNGTEKNQDCKTGNGARYELSFMIYSLLHSIVMPHVWQLLHSDTIHNTVNNQVLPHSRFGSIKIRLNQRLHWRSLFFFFIFKNKWPCSTNVVLVAEFFCYSSPLHGCFFHISIFIFSSGAKAWSFLIPKLRLELCYVVLGVFWRRGKIVRRIVAKRETSPGEERRKREREKIHLCSLLYE